MDTRPIDMRIAEMMCSRLCHDLVSPVGAIRNGLELLEDMNEGGSFAGEAADLIAHSAAQADRRLRLFRLAYGQAGRGVKEFADIRDTAANWLEGGRVSLLWPDGAIPEALIARHGLAKTLLNVIILGDEALPTGGTLAVSGDGTPAAGQVMVTAKGKSARLTADAEEGLEGDEAALAALSARSIHAFATGQFARTYGLRLDTESEPPTEVVFRLSW